MGEWGGIGWWLRVRGRKGGVVIVIEGKGMGVVVNNNMVKVDEGEKAG
ncbi:hypothetical protein [Paenibacillus sp. Y412MC10]|nr:hypothetical protein [Paenibacillus sp. Y412MC10]